MASPSAARVLEPCNALRADQVCGRQGASGGAPVKDSGSPLRGDFGFRAGWRRGCKRLRRCAKPVGPGFRCHGLQVTAAVAPASVAGRRRERRCDLSDGSVRTAWRGVDTSEAACRTASAVGLCPGSVSGLWPTWLSPTGRHAAGIGHCWGHASRPCAVGCQTALSVCRSGRSQAYVLLYS